MAVTGETAKFKLPYFKPGDSPPDMAAVTKAISERVEVLLAKGGDVSIAADGTITISQKDGEPATPSMRTLGTGAKQACAGNDSRLSNERVPTANSVEEGKIKDGAVSDKKLAKPVLCGEVAGTGSILSGSGFTVNHPEKGAFEVVLTSELPSIAVMVITVVSSKPCVAYHLGASKKTFPLKITDITGAATDQTFDFMIKQV